MVQYLQAKKSFLGKIFPYFYQATAHSCGQAFAKTPCLQLNNRREGITSLNNPDIIVKDERIVELDQIVNEVKQSEEWEAVKMNILEIGIQHGIEQGIEQGKAQGIEQGIEQGKTQGVVETCQELGISRSDTLRKLIEKFSLTEDAAKEQVDKYWH